MLSFKHFLRNYDKKYIALQLSENSQKAMRKWCISSGFDITKSYSHRDIRPEDFEFHATVFYSDNKKYIANGEFDIQPIKLNIKNLELFGKEKNIPVLVLEVTDELANIRKIYEAAGLKDSWPDWKPHLTVSYFYNNNIPVLEDVTLPDFPVTVDRIKIENQK